MSGKGRVQCAHCRGVYQLGDVEIVARYADCTMFRAPCCGQVVDDRRWKALPSFERLPREATVLANGDILMPDDLEDLS